MRCMGVHIACMTSGGRLSKRIMVEVVCAVDCGQCWRHWWGRGGTYKGRRSEERHGESRPRPGGQEEYPKRMWSSSTPQRTTLRSPMCHPLVTLSQPRLRDRKRSFLNLFRCTARTLVASAASWPPIPQSPSAQKKKISWNEHCSHAVSSPLCTRSAHSFLFHYSHSFCPLRSPIQCYPSGSIDTLR